MLWQGNGGVEFEISVERDIRRCKQLSSNAIKAVIKSIVYDSDLYNVITGCVYGSNKFGQQSKSIIKSVLYTLQQTALAILGSIPDEKRFLSSP